MMGPAIETERLQLIPLDQPQAEKLHALWTEPKVRRHLWDDRIIPSAQTADILRRNEELFARQGFGLWSICPRRTQALCGFAGFWHFREPPELELILGLAPDYWHKGLATEAGLALIRHGFEALGFMVIRGSTDAANTKSVQLMQRLGMQYEKRDVAAGLDTVFYQVRRSQFTAAQRSATSGKTALG